MPGTVAGASAGQKRPAAAANLLPDPRLLQRPRIDAGSPTPKQYRPEPPNRQPAAPAAAVAPASRLSASISAATQAFPSAVPASGSGSAQGSGGSHRAMTAAPSTGTQQNAVPGLEVFTSSTGTPSAPPRLPAESPPRTAPVVSAPASAAVPVAMEPPGLQDELLPPRTSHVLSHGGLSPGKAPMQRAAVNLIQPALKQLPPPTWLPVSQPPPQQQRQQQPQPSRSGVGATHQGNGVGPTAGRGLGVGLLPHLQHGQQPPASSSRPTLPVQHRQPNGALSARVSNQTVAASSVQQPGPAALSRQGVRPVELPPDVLRPLNQQQVPSKPSTTEKSTSLGMVMQSLSTVIHPSHKM